MPVINLSDEKIKRSPHGSGEIKCLGCGHEWVGVFELPLRIDLECPSCSMSRGVSRFNFRPETYCQCVCGCDIYHITPDSTVCLQCGNLTPLESLLQV